MEWDLKMPSWDLAEFDRDGPPDINNIGLVVLGSSEGGAAAAQAPRIDCSVDLKLGGLGDFGSPANWNGQEPKVSTSGSSKRPRRPSDCLHNASCSVDGCKADLSKCREYHRRHKVCEVHSKTPVVLVGGQEQRFCQQCSRFHMLTEFDEAKRSCRKRLDGHNRRRRKPQPDSINLGTSFSGARFASYSHIFPTTVLDPTWSRTVKEENPLYAPQPQPAPLVNGRDQYFPSPNSYGKERKQFPFLQESEIDLRSSTSFGTSVDEPQTRTLATLSGSTNGSNNSTKMFANEPARVALSLLSSPSQTSSGHLSHMVPSTDRIPIGQPLVPSLTYSDYVPYLHSQKPKTVSATGFSCASVNDDHVGTVLVPDANAIDLHCQSLFHFGGEGSSDGRNALPFSWQ